MQNKKRFPFIIILPFLLLLLVFRIIPILITTFRSFYTIVDGEYVFVNFQNFTKMFSDPILGKSIINTIIIFVINIIINIPFLLLISYILFKLKKGKQQYMKFLYLPTLVGTFAFAIIYRYLFTYDGIINSMLFSLLKIKINWLDNGFNAKNVFVIAMIWSSLGINTLLIVNALNNIPKDVLESAEVDGSNNFQSLIYIMIPYIKKLILFVVLTTFVATVNLLDLPYNLTQGAPNFETMTLGFYIYKVAFGYRDFSYAATIGITIFVLFIFIYISFKKVVSVYEKNI